jgi:branched-chain amino acid transport system substrate-binding protein
MDKGGTMEDHEHPNEDGELFDTPISRRSLLKSFGVGAVGLGAARLLRDKDYAEHLIARYGERPASSLGTIKIGYVTPETGALAGFSLADGYVLSKVRTTPQYTKGFKIGGKTYSVEIIPIDSQSSATRASEVAKQLILSDKVDLVVTSSAPETTNPVAATCEELRTPCLATVVPWQSWYAGLGGDPLKPTEKFAYNAMFFFGLEEFIGCFLPMWNRIEARTHAPKVFGGMFPNDADGNAFRAGFPPGAESKGYKFIDGGAYADGTTNFSSMIEMFKSNDVSFFVNCPLPPDFNTFWKQAVAQGFKPKLATVAKVLLFPADVIALGQLANNIATDAWWTPNSPYQSSLTGETTKDFATGYENKTGNEWIQSMGSTYSLFEIAYAAMTAIDDPHDKAQLAAELHKLSYRGMCGPVDFAKGPAPGVGIIEPVGIQWKRGVSTLGHKFPFQPFVVDNTLNKDVPLSGSLEETTY